MTTAIYLAGGYMEIDGIGVLPDVTISQPTTIGSSDEDRALNNHLITISMDPEIDHQLHVAHTYINRFISGEHVLDDFLSHQAAVDKSHNVTTDITIGTCAIKGLRGCTE